MHHFILLCWINFNFIDKYSILQRSWKRFVFVIGMQIITTSESIKKNGKLFQILD